MKSSYIISGCHDGATHQPSPGECTVKGCAWRFSCTVKANIVQNLISWNDVCSSDSLNLHYASPLELSWELNWKRESDKDLNISCLSFSIGYTVQKKKISLSTGVSYCYCAYLVTNVTIQHIWAVESLLNVQKQNWQNWLTHFFFNMNSNV